MALTRSDPALLETAGVVAHEDVTPMSKSNRTTARRGRGPRIDHNAIRLKLRPGSPVFAELYQVAAAEPEPDDLAAYLRTADARAAEFWQLVALACLRRYLGRPFTPRGYTRLRRALAQVAPQLAAAEAS